MARAVALLALLVVTPLVLLDTGGRALQNGDEAIYAQMAREMDAGGQWGTLTWQGEPLFPRPPEVVWILTAARRLLAPFGLDERAVRWPLALACGLEVALVILLGAALWGAAVGVLAGGVLATGDLFLGYARYLESEPFLCVMVLGALVCWERARRRPGWVLGWGALLGAALMTKQLVGGLPLIVLVTDRAGEPSGRVRSAAWGLAAAAVVALPWHIYAAMQHGRPFLDEYLLANVVQRSAAPMLHVTRWTFYARELWRSEGVHGLLAALAALALLGVGVARRRRAELLVGLWALGVFAVYSAAASRYDYYLLLAWPALALATAAALHHLPIPAFARALLALGFVCSAAYLHAPRNLGQFHGDDEVRTLAARASLERPARLYTYNTHAYSARYYSSVDVTTLLESDDDVRLAAELRRAGLPSSVRPAPDLPATLATLPRPWALLLPRARADLVRAAKLRQVADTRHYLLLASP